MYYLYHSHAAHEAAVARDAKRRPLIAELDRLRTIEREMLKTSQKIVTDGNVYEVAVHQARKAGRARHDNGIGPDPSVQVNLELALQESAAVGKATAATRAFVEDMYRIADDVQNALGGSDAIRKYRTDLQTYQTAQSLELTDWARAIEHIVDDDKIQLRDDSYISSDNADIEREYQLSDEEGSRAATSDNILSSEMDTLYDMVPNRIKALQAQLSNT